MEFDLKLKDDLIKGDYKSDDDEYVKMLEAESKRDYYLKIGMGTFYIILLVISLFII